MLVPNSCVICTTTHSEALYKDVVGLNSLLLIPLNISI
jgi:hypothetical protein